MPSITFDLETVTPLFLAGADQTTAELRPPAFRGALRYWFRAIAASITTFDEVKRWESKVFGNTDSGGAIIVRVQADKFESVLTRNKNRDLERFKGLAYLLFSMYGNSRAYFPQRYAFRVVLQSRPRSEDEVKCFDLAVASMWALVNLGSVGARSNRGIGSLRVKDNCEFKSLRFHIQSSDLNQLELEIKIGIQSMKNIFSRIIGQKTQSPELNPEFDVLHQSTTSLFLWQSTNSVNNTDFERLLNEFGDKYSSFRKRYGIDSNEDYRNVKNWLVQNNPSLRGTVKRAAFGLPIVFYFSSIKRENQDKSKDQQKPFKAMLEAKSSDGKKLDRVPSPFHIKVLQLSNGKLLVLLLGFRTRFLPTGSKLVLKKKVDGRNVTAQCSIPDQSIIEEFLQKELSNRLEVQIP